MGIEFLQIQHSANQILLRPHFIYPCHRPTPKIQVLFYPSKHRLYDDFPLPEDLLFLRILSFDPLPLDRLVMHTDLDHAAVFTRTAFPSMRTVLIVTTSKADELVVIRPLHLSLEIAKRMTVRTDAAVSLLIIHEQRWVIR